jgi:hypothetical protein
MDFICYLRENDVMLDLCQQVINKIKNTTRHQKASQIQRTWRKYKREKDKKAAAAQARDDLMKGLVDEVSATQPACRNCYTVRVVNVIRAYH